MQTQFASFLLETLTTDFPHIVQGDNKYDTRVIENAIALAESLYNTQELYVESPQTIAIVHGIVNLIRMHDGRSLRERSAQYEEFILQPSRSHILERNNAHSTVPFDAMLVWQASINMLRMPHKPLHGIDVVSCIGTTHSKIQLKSDNINEFICNYSVDEHTNEREIISCALQPLLESITSETQRVYFCAKVWYKKSIVGVHYTFSCVEARPKNIVATIATIDNNTSEFLSDTGD